MATYLHEDARGEVVEYRRKPGRRDILFIEGRVLRPDGTPFDDQWWLISDAEMVRLQHVGSDIVELLHEECFGDA